MSTLMPLATAPQPPVFDWPLPHDLCLKLGGRHAMEPAMLSMADGTHVLGTFLDLDPSTRTLRFRPDNRAAPQSLGFSSFRSIYLSRPVELTTVDGEHRDPAITPVKGTRPCTLSFRDGTELVTDIHGIIVRPFGLFLYVAHYGTQTLRWFVPSEAIERYRVADPLGKMLVNRAVVPPKAVDEALWRQQSLRGRPIGEYLHDAKAITRQQLEAALVRQKGMRHLRLGDALVQQTIITADQRDTALERQRADRTQPLGEILVEMGAIDRAMLQRVLVEQLGFPAVDLARFRPDPNAIKAVSDKLAHRLAAVPLYRSETRIAVAMENPLAWEVVQELEFYTGLKVDPVIADRDRILPALDRFYGPTQAHAITSLMAEMDDAAPVEPAAEEEIAAESGHVLVRVVNKMIADAFEQGASDIHVEARPEEKPTRVRFRIDGLMRAYTEIPANFRQALVSRIKIMAQMDISEKRRPQDGKLDFEQAGLPPLELRVVTLPTAHGLEDVVMRILSAPKALSLAQLGLAPRVLEGLKDAASKPYGLVFVCGPTGSGKTTTVHSLLAHINTPDHKIWTVEDPVEIVQEGLCQVQVNAKLGLGFVDVLRSFMRADPDVIMVGETRDAESARTVIAASLTGHLVVSTLHTNGAAESVVRLLDFGLDPFNFADAMLAILGQRLVRRLCPSCREPYEASRVEIESLANEYCRDSELTPAEVIAGWHARDSGADGEMTLYRACGCERCDQAGYKGRMGIHELLTATPLVKALILGRASGREMARAAAREGMLTLKQDGIDKVLQGHTDLAQVLLVSM